MAAGLHVVGHVLTRRSREQVIRDVGLCILLHDLLEVGDSMIYPGDGAAQVRVSFRMVKTHCRCSARVFLHVP